MASTAAASQPEFQPDSPDLPILPDKGNAVWTKPDVKAFIDYLISKKAAGGEGGFKMTTFRAAAVALAPTRTKGGPKTGKSCSQKYTALKKIWTFIDTIKGISGWSWSDTKGVDVTPASKGTWDAYVLKHPEVARFRNEGWPYYDLMAPLMPSKAKGSHVFRAAAAPTAPTARSLSPDWDEDQLAHNFGGGDNSDAGDADRVTGDTGGAAGDTGDMDDDAGGGAPDAGDADDDENPDSSSPAPSVRNGKRTAAQPAPMYRKKPKLSGGARALEMLATSAVDFNDMFANFLSAPATTPATASTTASTSMTPAFQTSPQRRIGAIMLAQKEAWLSPAQRVALIKILRDVTKADVYTALLTEEIRIPWVLDELNDAGIIAFHPMYSDLELKF
ncbi:hypothetical protein B0H10DRAFT_2447572 [Mycena sp. CBHHK59/15]|nr:hypothetical protein B0H10DRAFT_2447572 [Mycena sp. CBHHK59/15]